MLNTGGVGGGGASAKELAQLEYTEREFSQLAPWQQAIELKKMRGAAER